MSSIEKYVDQLSKPAKPAKPASTNKMKSGLINTDAPPVKDSINRNFASSDLSAPIKSQTSRKIELDFDRIAAMGMLTPNQVSGKLSEEYRAIKRPLLNNAFSDTKISGRHSNLIMVTSALPGEGKSFSSINLAISMASEMDRTVLLVEADVAKPAICKYVGVSEPDKGLIDYLEQPDISLASLMLKTNIPKLSILPAGRQHAHSSELLASDNMSKLMEELAGRYSDRVVVFDSPPLLLTNEAVILAEFMGQVVLVVESGYTQKSQVKAAISLLTDKQIIGILLNKTNGGSKLGYGGYGYGYGYGGGV